MNWKIMETTTAEIAITARRTSNFLRNVETLLTDAEDASYWQLEAAISTAEQRIEGFYECLRNRWHGEVADAEAK